MYPFHLYVQAQSSQLFSTVSRTRFVYSLRFSLYKLDASTLAGDDVFGSLSKLLSSVLPVTPGPSHDVPLNARQDGRHVVCG
jgi:hypothetical protein